MGEGHDHGSAAAAQHAGSAYRRRLLIAFVLIGGFFLVELVGGLVTNSLALLSDAGHMFTDVLGLGMALAAIRAASRRNEDPTRTFGMYRLEILAALANAVLLFGVASVHLRLVDGCGLDDGHRVLDRARALLRDTHGLDHATVQIEPAAHAHCAEAEGVTW